jgi:hypothetical protein
MKYNIDEKFFKIEIKGSKKEIKRFAKCLVEIIDKNLVSEFEYHVKYNYSQPINLTATQRIYLTEDSLLYIPNLSDGDRKRLEFKFMKENYEKAKENFLK